MLTWVNEKGFSDSRKTPWRPWEAVAYGSGQVDHPYENYHALCDHFVASCYGYVGSGFGSAAAHWAGIPDTFKTPKGANPPRGALVFWTGGSDGYGHVALSLGNGWILSNDIKRDGYIDRVTLESPVTQWGHVYAGWAQPWFLGWGTNPHPKPDAPNPHNVASRALRRVRRAIAATVAALKKLRGRRKHLTDIVNN